MSATPSISEASTMPTPLPPFTPHRIRLVGHRDLGIVPARYVGCWLEIDHPEHGGRYGPAAVFRAEPVVEVVAEAKASRGALVWLCTNENWYLVRPGVTSYMDCIYGAAFDFASSYKMDGAAETRDERCADHAAAIAQITTWAREDGYEVPPWPGEPAAPVEPQPEPVPAPVGTWGGHTDWIAWGGGECPVDQRTRVQTVFRSEASGDRRWDAGISDASQWTWGHYNSPYDIIAYRIVQPAPAPKPNRTIYNPDDVQRGDRHTLTDGTRGTVLGVIDGWIAYSDRLPVVQCAAGIVRVEPAAPTGNF